MDYEVRRYISDTDYIASLATAFINILSDDDGSSDDESSDDDESAGDGKKARHRAHAEAALPNTGASTDLNLIGGIGIALVICGIFMVGATPRRRGAHRA